MLKKLLILALTLNTSHILPSDSPSDPQNLSLKTSLGLAVPGMICAWIAIKIFKEEFRASNEASKEIDRQVNNLRDMGVKNETRESIGAWSAVGSFVLLVPIVDHIKTALVKRSMP